MLPLSPQLRVALDVLGLPDHASRDDVVRAFRQLARDQHPDVNDAPDAPARFEALVDAYGEALRGLAARPPVADPPPPPATAPPAAPPVAGRPPIVAGPPLVERAAGSSSTGGRSR